MKKRRSSKGIWIDIGVLIICLAIISSCISSSMFAKFVTKAGSAKDKAKIASFNVIAKLDPASPEAPTLADVGSTAEYELVLNNKAEVAVSYSVTFEFAKEAAGLSVSVGSKEGKVDENGMVAFPDLGTMDPKGSKTLTVTVTRGEDYQLPEDASEDLILDFTAKVLFSQID